MTARPPRWSRCRRWPVLLVVALAAVACRGGSGGEVSWRDLEVELPPGWVVFEQEPQYLSVADAEAGEEPGDAGGREAAAFFSHEPGTLPDDWREFVEEVGGELETDRAVEVGGLPATQLVFAHESNGIATREMIVLVPSRNVVILMQPIITAGQTDGPERFEAHRDEFEALLSGISFGAPTDAAPA